MLNNFFSHPQIRDKRIVFWDFDGVIKDSVEVKTKAFEALFLPFGSYVADKVVSHHKSNGGLSRFEKIPLYMDWAGLAVEERAVQEFCDSFSLTVKQAVIDSPWVPGVLDCLKQNYKDKIFILTTATPQPEIEEIIDRLAIRHYFQAIFGAPVPKSEAINISLARESCSQQQAVIIGDSESDLLAAKAGGILFLLRCTNINNMVQMDYQGPQFKDFLT